MEITVTYLHVIHSFVLVQMCLGAITRFDENKYRRMIFQRVYQYIWVIAEHEQSILSIRVPNSLTLHDNLYLKFDIFSEFQNDISDSPPPSQPLSVIMTHCLQKSICDLSLSQYELILRLTETYL